MTQICNTGYILRTGRGGSKKTPKFHGRHIWKPYLKAEMAFFRQAVQMRSLHTGRATRMSAKGAAEDHGSERTWKMFSVFGAIPILIACSATQP